MPEAGAHYNSSQHDKYVKLDTSAVRTVRCQVQHPTETVVPQPWFALWGGLGLTQRGALLPSAE